MTYDSDRTMVDDILRQARDAITVDRVFATPYEKDGVVIIPAAAVRGGGGGGGGNDDAAGGSGGGFGVSARPVGAYVIKDGQASWQPAMDLTRILVFGQIVALGALLVVRALVKSVGKRRRRR